MSTWSGQIHGEEVAVKKTFSQSIEVGGIVIAGGVVPAYPMKMLQS